MPGSSLREAADINKPRHSAQTQGPMGGPRSSEDKGFGRSSSLYGSTLQPPSRNRSICDTHQALRLPVCGRMADEHRPLLPSDRIRVQHRSDVSTSITAARHQAKRYLTSKTGHYSVLLLVSLDISCILADLILQLLTCEGRVKSKDGKQAQGALGIIALVFSCLFMVGIRFAQ